MNIIKRFAIFSFMVLSLSVGLVSTGPMTTSANSQNCGSGRTFFGIPAWHRGLTTKDCDIKKISEKKSDQASGAIGVTAFIWTIILNISDGIFRIAGIVATGFIVWAGFQYMLSQGSKDKIKAAKTTLVNAIIGLIITVLAVALTNFGLGLVQGG